MSWTEYQAPSAEIPLGNGATGRVRGLNVDDLSILVTNHLEPISHAVALYAKSKKDVYTRSNLHEFVISAASQFPGLISEVISLAADEPSVKSKRLSLGVQVAALDKITVLTIKEVGGLGNLSLVLGSLAKAALERAGQSRGPAGESKTTLPGSIGGSDKT